jgi:hypothetical protein
MRIDSGKRDRQLRGGDILIAKRISSELHLSVRDQHELEALELLLALQRRSRKRVIAAARLVDEIQTGNFLDDHGAQTNQDG